jgi:hypothetical protein
MTERVGSLGRSPLSSASSEPVTSPAAPSAASSARVQRRRTCRRRVRDDLGIVSPFAMGPAARCGQAALLVPPLPHATNQPGTPPTSTHSARKRKHALPIPIEPHTNTN